MVQRRGSTRLTSETLECLGIVGDVVGKKLDSDKAAELSVFRLIDNAHSSAAQLVQDAVVRNGLAQWGRGGHAGKY
jgi:hypothetical protein